MYDPSRAGPWYPLFRQGQGVCGNTIAAGPQTHAGPMITIDGRRYWETGDGYVAYTGR